MRRLTRTIGIMAILAMIATACGDDTTTTTAAPTTTEAATTTAGETTTTAAEETTTTAAAGGPLSEYGEDPGAADSALVEKALGGAETRRVDGVVRTRTTFNETLRRLA